MNNNEFLNEITKLEINYREEITSQQKKMWYNDLKGLPIERFKEIINEIIKTENYIPKLAKFFEINKEISLKKAYVGIKKVKCDICRGDGFLSYNVERDGYRYQYVCRCKCLNATRYKAFPSIQDVGFSEKDFIRS